MVSKRSANAINIGRYNDLVTSWLTAQISANTRSAYRSDLANFGQWCARQESIPLRAGTADIVSYQGACAEAGQSPSTVRRRSSSLSSFFQFALDAGTIAVNPVLGSNRPPVAGGDPSTTATLDAAFVEQYLLGAAEFDSRLHALVALLVFDGLKLSEALALDTDDLSGRPSRFTASVARPDGPRHVILHRHSSVAVRRCAGDRRNEPLFVSGRRTSEDARPRRLTRFGADHLIRQLPGPDGPPITTNALRRFYVASNHAAGVDLETIRVRAGLGDRRTVNRYLITAPAARVRRSRDPAPQQRDPQHRAGPGSDRRPDNNPQSKEV